MSNRTALTMVIAIIIVGFALRLFRLDAVPLRGDEAFSVVNWARQPLADSLTNTAAIEPHPPLTYIFFRSWGLLVGTEEFAMRLLPALFNLLGIPALFALGYRLGGRRLGVLSALLWAIHPFEIWHSQDARNYAIWAGLSITSAWLGLRVLEKSGGVDRLLYLGIAVAAIQVYYLELFMLAALGLYAIISRRRNWRSTLPLLLVQAIIVASAILSFLVLQGQLFASSGYGGTTGGGLDAPQLLTWFIPALSFGETLPADFVAVVWPFLIVPLLVGILVLWRQTRDRAVFLALMGFLPLVLLGLVSLRLDVFVPHYILSAAPFYSLIFASLILGIDDYLRGYSIRGLTVIALLSAWILVSSFSLYNYFFIADYAKAANWPALTNYLRSQAQADDVVVQMSVDPAFGFYYDAPALDIALPAEPDQPPAEIIRILQDFSSSHRSLWLVGQTFPDWPNVGVVERWTQENMQLVRSTQTAGLHIQQFMPWEVRDAEIERTPLASFSDVVELVGVHVFTPPEPTGELTIWAYWHPLETTETPLKVFVHLIGVTNPATGTPLWAQDDQSPQDGRAHTTNWTPAAVYRDVYVLSVASVPAGDYTLVIGLYDPATGERLSVNDGDSYIIRALHLP
jgi:hypothetical protein